MVEAQNGSRGNEDNMKKQFLCTFQGQRFHVCDTIHPSMSLSMMAEYTVFVRTPEPGSGSEAVMTETATPSGPS